MYEIQTTGVFNKSFDKLPKGAQKEVMVLLGILAIDYRDQRLHSKKLHGNLIEYSFRIRRDYRCIFCFEDGNTILLLDIAHRKDIYKK
ncbi:MAG: type II toxin-antitoxin system RelE/ParE family toxin [Candidatus Yonathbacteria bacterium]|nr:type II toxin-antitoxin system RelE/ParE family toxin [Candidatus Yonathbacteria bacterium]